MGCIVYLVPICHLGKIPVYNVAMGESLCIFPPMNFVTIDIFVTVKIAKLLERWHYAWYTAQDTLLHNLLELSPVCCKRQTDAWKVYCHPSDVIEPKAGWIRLYFILATLWKQPAQYPQKLMLFKEVSLFEYFNGGYCLHKVITLSKCLVKYILNYIFVIFLWKFSSDRREKNVTHFPVSPT